MNLMPLLLQRKQTRPITHFTGCFNKLKQTSPKPVEHGYVFSMAVGTIEEWLKLIPFFC